MGKNKIMLLCCALCFVLLPLLYVRGDVTCAAASASADVNDDADDDDDDGGFFTNTKMEITTNTCECAFAFARPTTMTAITNQIEIQKDGRSTKYCKIKLKQMAGYEKFIICCILYFVCVF